MKTNRNISFGKSTITSTESSFLKSFSIYGLTSSTYEKINNSDDSMLHITPCVYIPNGSTGSVYLDYNNETNIEYPAIKSFFGLIEAGSTLTIIDAGYNYDEFSLNGSYIFSELINSIVVLQGISLNNLSNSFLKYYPEKFDKNPKIILSSTILDPLPGNQLIIENVFSRGSNSLINQGILNNDIIEYGEYKFKVISLTKNIHTNSENLLVDITGINSNNIQFNFSDLTILNLYRS